MLGKAEQAVMLLMGVFLRPVIMIIGFLAAMVMARVTLRIVNAGFGHAAGMANITMSGANIFGIVGLMIVYTMIVLSIINLVFTAGVVKLWENIWMWVGFHQPSSSAETALQEIKSGVHGGAQAMGDFGGGMTKGLGDSLANIIDGKQKEARKQGVQIGNAGNQGPGGGGGGGAVGVPAAAAGAGGAPVPAAGNAGAGGGLNVVGGGNAAVSGGTP